MFDVSVSHLRRAKALVLTGADSRVEVPDSIRMSRTSFPAFCEAMGKPNARHHNEWVREFITEQSSSRLMRIAGENTAILAPRGPLAAGTLVATPGGWRTIEELGVGDLVFGDNGMEVEVVDTVSYGATECFEVVFSDGTSMVCDDSHRFDVRRVSGGNSSWYTTTLQDLRTFITIGMKGNWRTGVSRVVRAAVDGEKAWIDARGHARYAVPVCHAVQYEEASLPLDPYLLGVLLGDGGLTESSVRFTKADVDADVVERVRLKLPAGMAMREIRNHPGEYVIADERGKRGPKGVRSSVAQALADLGLMGKSSSGKFIPRVYLEASVDQRIMLLQGLMDTDGGRDSRKNGKTAGGGLTYSTVSHELFLNICELIRSLGGLATPRKPQLGKYKRPDGETVVCRMSFRMGIRLPAWIVPFQCERKLDGYRPVSPSSNSGLVRTIIDIRPVGLRPLHCITIDHEDERFLIDGYVVSKNSAKSTFVNLLVAWLLGIHSAERRLLRVLYLSYSLDIARSKSHTIKKVIESRIYRQAFPTVRLSKDRTSDELWSIDMDYADIALEGDDPFSCVAQGLGGSITSRRGDLIVIDDCVKSAESIQNPDIRAKLIANWQQVVQPCLLDGGRCISLGTRFSSVDIYGTTFTEKNGWKVITDQAILTDDYGLEVSYWPEMWSLGYLQKLRREDPISFSYQFMNRPVSMSDIDFPADWLKAADLTNSYDALVVGIDLSSALKERNDYTVMTLMGIVDDRVEVIDFRRMRVMGNLEKLDEICRLLSDHGLLVEGEDDQEGRWFPTEFPVTLNIEAISYQQSLQADAKEILHNQRGLHNLVIKAVTGYKGDKMSRLRGTLGLFQTARVTWNRWINWEPFWSEFLNFGMCDHDDCVDSFVLGIRGLVGTGRLQTAWGTWNQGEDPDPRQRSAYPDASEVD